MSTTRENQAAGDEGFIRVSTARKRYFGGAMSLRWWYRKIELGRLPHFRAGGNVPWLRAQVHEANAASQQVFERCGFCRVAFEFSRAAVLVEDQDGRKGGAS